MSKVYFIEASATESEEVLGEKVRTLFDKAGFASIFKPKDIAALKLHVGEPGTKTFVKPPIAAALVKCIKQTGARPFLTDTSVLYQSPRDTGLGHVLVAEEHGFTLSSVGAPFIPADGILGKDDVTIAVYGKHFEEVAIAAAIAESRSMLVLSHATGHLGTGFGGALKNLGMGCSSRKAKLSQHHGQAPHIDAKACTACGTCAAHCPSDAISVTDTATIDTDKCIGCGECVAMCREDAVAFDWGVMGQELEERIVEHALGVVRALSGRIGYITAAIDITKDCDCLGVNQPPLLKDIGFLASFDPTALDKAVHDLIIERAGRTLESMSYPKHDGTIQIRYAEKIGLGSSVYELVKVS
jgi:uncharacterized Fe-S center protein